MVTHMHACIVENKQEDMLAVMYTGSSTVLYVRVVCGRSRSVGEMCSFKEQRNVLMGILLFLRFSFSYCYCYGRSFMHSSSGTTKNPFTSDHDGGCAVSGIASLVQTSEPKHQGKNHQATNKRTGAMPMPMPTSGDFHVPIPGLVWLPSIMSGSGRFSTFLFPREGKGWAKVSVSKWAQFCPNL